MILITMAGLSSRFAKAGYSLPKYMLEINGKTIFEHAVRSFEYYFDDEEFLFILRPDSTAKEFVEKKVSELGIKRYSVLVLEKDTRGQAETAYLALKHYNHDFGITIFNIDTIRYNYKKPLFLDECDGYLEVFSAEGEHWSFIEPGSNFNVLRTTEKDRISDLCSDGLYYFKSQKQFCHLFEVAVQNNNQVKGEFYIAPLYNDLIQAGFIIKYDQIQLNQIEFCGTPAEYEMLKKKWAL